MKTSHIDVRGLACPEPLIAFTNEAKKTDVAEIEILFDCGAARDNISRAAASMGWKINEVNEAAGGHTLMKLAKKA